MLVGWHRRDMGRSCEGLGWTDDGFSGKREVFNTDRGTSNRDSGYRRCPKLNIWDQRSRWVARAEWDNGHDISVWWATHLDFISKLSSKEWRRHLRRQK